jgi:CRISPR/Cas system-associated exonuclease Cas4 (RecB family)
LPDLKLRTYENLAKLFRRNWQREGFTSLEEEIEWGKKGLKVLEIFYHAEDHSITPLALEKNLEAKYDEIILCGRVDRIDSLTKNKVRIVDYKTGKDELDKDQAALAATIHKFVVETRLKKEVVEVIHYYLESGCKYQVLPPSDRVKEMLTEVVKIAHKIENTKEFLPQVSPLCQWCDFVEICPESTNFKTECIN